MTRREQPSRIEQRPASGRPSATNEAVRRRLQTTRRRNTLAEMALRRELYARGLRYRVDWSPLPGLRRRGDIVFVKARTMVFVDGCFWHGCPLHGTWPKANAEWWRQKIKTNIARDAHTDGVLCTAGFHVVRVMHTRTCPEPRKRIKATVERRKARSDGPPYSYRSKAV